MTRPIPIALALLGLTLTPLNAQDFNARPPNAQNQNPAFAGQTRAPVITDTIALNVTPVATGLEHPWGMVELPDGQWLVTERPGRLRLIAPDGTVPPPITGLPAVDTRRQGGLLDVVVRDDFAQTRRVWWSYAEPRDGKTATAVATGVLATDGTALSDVKVIFRQNPAWDSTLHYGSRLVFDRAGMLFVTTGERSLPEPRKLAQDVTTHLGKVLRLDPDGGAAPDNPGIAGALPEIWSSGHRNIQSAALAPDGTLWTAEHGARGGDEVNHTLGGRNYGWPLATYGVEYSGARIGDGTTARDGLEQPVYYWDPVIAPSGMAFYDGALFPDWRGDMLIGGLASQSLVRLTIDDGRVTGEARYLQGQGRVRDVAVARDGAVMILTDQADGAVLRLTPGG